MPFGAVTAQGHGGDEEHQVAASSINQVAVHGLFISVFRSHLRNFRPGIAGGKTTAALNLARSSILDCAALPLLKKVAGSLVVKLKERGKIAFVAFSNHHAPEQTPC